MHFNQGQLDVMHSRQGMWPWFVEDGTAEAEAKRQGRGSHPQPRPRLPDKGKSDEFL